MHICPQLTSSSAFENCLLFKSLLSISMHPYPTLQFLPSPAARAQAKEEIRVTGVLKVSYSPIQAEKNIRKSGRLVTFEVLQSKTE